MLIFLVTVTQSDCTLWTTPDVPGFVTYGLKVYLMMYQEVALSKQNFLQVLYLNQSPASNSYFNVMTYGMNHYQAKPFYPPTSHYQNIITWKNFTYHRYDMQMALFRV